MATEAEKETTGKGQLVIMYFIGKKKRTENVIKPFEKDNECYKKWFVYFLHFAGTKIFLWQIVHVLSY